MQYLTQQNFDTRYAQANEITEKMSKAVYYTFNTKSTIVNFLSDEEITTLNALLDKVNKGLADK